MKRLIILLMLVYPTAVSGEQVKNVAYYIYNAATEFNLDPSLMYAICHVESHCKPSAINHNDGTSKQKELGIISKSHGMFQIKLSTAKGLGFKGNAQQLQSPSVNVWYAAKYLNHLYKRYNDTLKVISAYNAGTYTTKNKTYVSRVLETYIKHNIDGK